MANKGQALPPCDFSFAKLNCNEQKNRIDPHCKACVAKFTAAGTPNRCRRCRLWFGEDAFVKESQDVPVPKMTCRTCVQKEFMTTCIVCSELKPLQDFSPKMRKSNAHKRKCLACEKGFVCPGCKRVRRFGNFAKSELSKPEGTWLCATCMTRKCSKCFQLKTSKNFSCAQWNSPAARMLCATCETKRCNSCNETKNVQAMMSTIGNVRTMKSVACAYVVVR